MYDANEITKVGYSYSIGSLLVLVAGIATQLWVGFPPATAIGGNLLYYVLVSLGWFMFNQLMMASVYNKLVPNEEALTTLFRLKMPLEKLENRSYLRIELGFIVLWLVSVTLVQLVFGQYLAMPLGGLAGGWLNGSGIGRIRFASKIRQEQTLQTRLFYFGDSMLTSRTEIAYYTSRTDDKQPYGAPTEPTIISTSESSLPPGVKRRATIKNKQQ